MIRTLLPAFAVVSALALAACDGGKPSASSSTSSSTPSAGAPAAEPAITPENLDAELDKLDAEIAAQ